MWQILFDHPVSARLSFSQQTTHKHGGTATGSDEPYLSNKIKILYIAHTDLTGIIVSRVDA
jgi:hypothetical protein